MIPKKIQSNFRTTLQKKDGNHFLTEGILTCCNSHDFEVFVVGEIKHRTFSKMFLSSENDKLVLEVRCKKCGKVISVFDSSCDGYEQCGTSQSSHIPTKPIYCQKCQDNSFSVGIQYEYPDIQELEELEIPEIDNAFTWIWGTLECNKCGARYRNFLNYETT